MHPVPPAVLSDTFQKSSPLHAGDDFNPADNTPHILALRVNAREKSEVTHITVDSQPLFATNMYIKVDGGSIVMMASSSGTLCRSDPENGGKSASI